MKQPQAPLSSLDEAALLESVFTQVTDGMVILRPDYTIGKYNHSFTRQVSGVEDPILGARIDRILPEWDPKFFDLCDQVRESKKAFIDQAMKILPLFNQDRTFAGWLLLFPNRGAGRYPPLDKIGLKTKQTLTDSIRKIHIEQLLSAAVLHNSPVAIAVFDSVSLRLKWANPICRAYLEESNDDPKLLGHTLAQLVPGAETSGLTAICQHVAATGDPFFTPELQVGGFERGVAYWRLTIVRLEMNGQEGPVLLFIIVDVTDEIKARKQKEVLTKIAETGLAPMEAVLNSLTEGIIIIDPRPQVVFVNPAGLRIVGFSTSDEALRPLADYQQRFRCKPGR